MHNRNKKCQKLGAIKEVLQDIEKDIIIRVSVQEMSNVMTNEHKEVFSKNEYQGTFERCKKTAEQGDAPSQHNLGLMYRKGDGVEKIINKALT
ncbi:hypothetical protein AGMMS49592_2450 [Endomicrobiia bacterium]|nr:hypothetical protein AGMMS49592_2450 [Endomicrobiia bacterium]